MFKVLNTAERSPLIFRGAFAAGVDMTEACVRLYRDESALRFRDEIGDDLDARPPDEGAGGRGGTLARAVADLFGLYQEPCIEIRNRVWTVTSPSHRLPLNILMDNHRDLNTAQVASNLLRLEWRGKRCVRVEHGEALIHIWLNSGNKFRGGMLIDFQVPGIGFKKCHAKIYNDSDTVQLFGCGVRVEYALKAYTELKHIMDQLHPAFSGFARNDQAALRNLKFVNENSKINMGVRVESSIDTLALVVKADWARHRKDGKASVFAEIESVKTGKNRLYVTVAEGDQRAVVTLFESGRGHISARTSHCRVLAWLVLLKLIEMYGSHFIRTYEDIDRQKQHTDAVSETKGTGRPERHTPNFSSQRPSPY